MSDAKKPRRKARMKRTPLKQGTEPLKRRKALKTKVPLERRAKLSAAPLKRRVKTRVGYEKQKAEQWHHATILRARRRAESGGWEYACPSCGRTLPVSRLQAHHVVTQEAIRGYVRSLRLPLEDAIRLLVRCLWDKRNGLAVCNTCHDRHTKAVKRLDRSLLDSKHEQFAREVGLESHLDRYYESSQSDGGGTNDG